MARERALPEAARRILELADTDRAAAAEALERLSLEGQVGLVCETPLARRAALLDLLRDPRRVVRGLPEAELCFTVKALGLEDAGWLLECASGEQLQACLDLDAWSGFTPAEERLDAWFHACAQAGDATLLRAARALDAELLVLWIRARAEVQLKPEDPGWQPPTGARTLDGQFHLLARRADDDLADVLHLLGLLFERDYWFYFRALQGVMHELASDLEEWALRWRDGRLQDLGFPAWQEAMRIYAVLSAEQRAGLPAAGGAPALGEWHLPVWLPDLPVTADSAQAVFRAAAELDGDERRAFFYAFVALANRVAVAERLPLGDPESIPRAIEKAAAVASRGLEWLAKEHGLRPVATLRRVGLVRLFRVGHSLDRPRGPV